MSARTIAPSDADRLFYEDATALIKRYLTPDTQERVLAIASQIVGKILAMQDQRTMTPERGLAIISANIEAGNQQVIANLIDEKGGSA